MHHNWWENIIVYGNYSMMGPSPVSVLYTWDIFSHFLRILYWLVEYICHVEEMTLMTGNRASFIYAGKWTCTVREIVSWHRSHKLSVADSLFSIDWTWSVCNDSPFIVSDFYISFLLKNQLREVYLVPRWVLQPMQGQKDTWVVQFHSTVLHQKRVYTRSGTSSPRYPIIVCSCL